MEIQRHPVSRAQVDVEAHALRARAHVLGLAPDTRLPEGEEVVRMKLTNEKISFIRFLAASERWECEITGLPAHASMALSKATVNQLLDAHDQLAAEHALRVQIEKERAETARQAARLLDENLRLREALAERDEAERLAGASFSYFANATNTEKP